MEHDYDGRELADAGTAVAREGKQILADLLAACAFGSFPRPISARAGAIRGRVNR